MAVTQCIVLKEYGVVRLNAAIAAAVASGFTPQPGLMAGEGNWIMMVMKKEDAITVTSCVVKIVTGVERLGQEITAALAGGLVPFGNIEPIGSDDYGVVFIAGSSGGGGSVSVDDITGAGATGKALMKAADATTARAAIGAGTSNLAIGTTSTTAKAGDYQPAAVNISDASAVGRSVLTATDAATARTAIGAGTGNSNLVVGTASNQAKAGNYQPTAANISDAGTFGRQLLQAADQAAAKTLLGIV